LGYLVSISQLAFESAILKAVLPKLAYESGTRAALLRIGMEKWAVIGARTILPRLAEATGQALKKAPAALRAPRAALPEGMLAQPSVVQHMALAKPGGAAESATSKLFRGELTSQLTPQQRRMMLGGSLPAPAPTSASSAWHPKGPESFAKTMAPPRAPSMATVPPPGRAQPVAQ
jgi:hypothetical protein